MLVISRHQNKKIRVLDQHTGEEIWIIVVELRGDKVRLGIEASDRFEIMREELCKEVDFQKGRTKGGAE